MADSVGPSTSTVVLRKRKRSPEKLALRISSSPSLALETSATESEYEPRSTTSGAEDFHAAQSGTPRRSKGHETSSYRCAHDGCTKVYSKPSRLAEHERSHTGDRPFVCMTCQKSYFRETHLQAHARSHLPESEKPFACAEQGCGKRFWTSQHLRVHSQLHSGEQPFKCAEGSCDAAFSKHHQLREHIASEHCPPGTKSYRCERNECTKSFATSQKLRAHMKTHDEKRYTCIHQSCVPATGAEPAYYPTWSALQHHMRTAHPPTCPYASCKGKTFTAQKGLRAHLKIHVDRDAEAELDAEAAQSADEDQLPPRKRRRGGELGRDWVCQVEGCGKDFKSKKALNTHENVTHLGRRDFTCTQCARAFGYKHLLQRHVAKCHALEPPASDAGDPSDSGAEDNLSSGEEDAEAPSTIDLITGKVYADRAQVQAKSHTTLQCPHPNTSVLLGEGRADLSPSGCRYIFSRAYDLRRHLRSEHGVDIDKDTVDKWVRVRKAADST